MPISNIIRYTCWLKVVQLFHISVLLMYSNETFNLVCGNYLIMPNICGLDCINKMIYKYG